MGRLSLSDQTGVRHWRIPRPGPGAVTTGTGDRSGGKLRVMVIQTFTSFLCVMQIWCLSFALFGSDEVILCNSFVSFALTEWLKCLILLWERRNRWKSVCYEMVCSIHIFLLSPLSYKDKWTLNWRSICTIPLTLVFSCKRWKHSRPPVRVILAWKNRDEKIEASSEEGRRETQPAKDCSGSRNILRVSNKVDQSQLMGTDHLKTNSRQRKWCIGSAALFDFFSQLD